MALRWWFVDWCLLFLLPRQEFDQRKWCRCIIWQTSRQVGTLSRDRSCKEWKHIWWLLVDTFPKSCSGTLAWFPWSKRRDLSLHLPEHWWVFLHYHFRIASPYQELGSLLSSKESILLEVLHQIQHPVRMIWDHLCRWPFAFLLSSYCRSSTLQNLLQFHSRSISQTRAPAI